MLSIAERVVRVIGCNHRNPLLRPQASLVLQVLALSDLPLLLRLGLLRLCVASTAISLLTRSVNDYSFLVNNALLEETLKRRPFLKEPDQVEVSQ